MSGSFSVSLALALNQGLKCFHSFIIQGKVDLFFHRTQIMKCTNTSGDLFFVCLFFFFTLGNLVTGQGSPCVGCLWRPGKYGEGHGGLPASCQGVTEPCSQRPALAAADEGHWGQFPGS